MAELIKSGLLLLMTEKCFDNYFLDFNFLDREFFFADDITEIF